VRFIVFVIDDTTGSASGDEMHHINAFNDRLRADGQWVMAAGIAAPERARVVDGRAGRESTRPGSLFEDTEYYSGFWIIEAESQEIAERLALAGSRACNRRVELRPFLG
jgi:hypothetical protein